MPTINRRKLAQLSRDPGFLVRASLTLVVLAVILSGLLSALVPHPTTESFLEEYPGHSSPGDEIPENLDMKDLTGVIRNRPGTLSGNLPKDLRETLDFQSKNLSESADYALLKKRVEGSASINIEQRELLLLLLEGLHCTDARRISAVERLAAISETVQFRNEFLGDIYLAMKNPDAGIEAFTREGEIFPNATYSQRSAVIAYMERKDPVRLRELLSKPGFREAITPREGIEASSITGNYRQLLVDVFKIELVLFKSPHLFTALFTAAIWFIILVSMGSLTKPQLFWGILSFCLGIFSAMLTLYVVHLQEFYLNLEFHVEDTLINQSIALVAGIGLREETLKLLCFVPIAFAILKFQSPVFALVTAALTGLGFAMMENLQYFVYTTDNFVAWNRLLSANALHFCLTGIAGFSFYEMIRRRGRGWENFLVDFLLVVVTHGIYDGFLMIPMLTEYNIVTLIILALTAYRYLDQVKHHMSGDGQLRKISPLGVFVLGSALLACGIMVVTSLSHSFLQSTGAFAGAIGGSIPIAFAFISRLRDL